MARRCRVHEEARTQPDSPRGVGQRAGQPLAKNANAHEPRAAHRLLRHPGSGPGVSRTTRFRAAWALDIVYPPANDARTWAHSARGGGLPYGGMKQACVTARCPGYCRWLPTSTASSMGSPSRSTPTVGPRALPDAHPLKLQGSILPSATWERRPVQSWGIGAAE